MRKASLALLVLAATLRAPRASAGLLPTDPTVDRLPNGLQLVVVPWDSPGIVAYFTLVRTGSRDEAERGHSGFAHLFEHMMFRGSVNYPRDRYEALMQEFGADDNAFTTDDFTLYTTTVPKSVLPRMVEMNADRFQRLSYTEDVFRTETGAVLGEYNKSASDPYLKMSEALAETAFTRHTYAHTTIGYLRDIQAMPSKYDYSVRFLRRFYTPDNCAVILVGDVTRGEALPLVTAAYSSWAGRRDRPRIAAEPAQTAPRRRHVEWDGQSPPKMLIGYKTPAFSVDTRDTAALEVIHEMAFGESSDLYQRLVVREQTLLDLGSWSEDFHRDPQLFTVDVKLKPGGEFDPVLTAITAELSRIASGGIPAARIAEVQSHLRYRFQMRLETPTQVATQLGAFMAMTGDVSAMERYVDQLAAVTPEDVARVAGAYLTEARRTVITLAPRAGGAR
jgi:zinc protease